LLGDVEAIDLIGFDAVRGHSVEHPLPQAREDVLLAESCERDPRLEGRVELIDSANEQVDQRLAELAARLAIDRVPAEDRVDMPVELRTVSCP
jgi:hypothetical protein